MNKDLGCVEIVKIDENNLASTTYTNGLLFVWSNKHSNGGCWSALGLAPGFTNGNGNIVSFGAPSAWQFVGLDDTSCVGYKSPTVTHEVMHALGVAHEHQRPDRDDTIVVDYNEIDPSWTDQFTKLNNNEWWDSGHPLEIASAMMYSSYAGIADYSPSMVLKADGSTWSNHGSMTTTDALQVQYLYCRNTPGFQYKESITCPSADVTGHHFPVFTDRFCDNTPDCPGLEEETGIMAPCEQLGSITGNGCCTILVVGDDTCVYDGQHLGRDGYQCSNSNNVIKWISWLNAWVYDSTKWNNGLIQSLQYFDLALGSSMCPPVGARWHQNTFVSCKQKGIVGATSTTTTTTTATTTTSTTTSTTITTTSTTTTTTITSASCLDDTGTNNWTGGNPEKENCRLPVCDRIFTIEDKWRKPWGRHHNGTRSFRYGWNIQMNIAGDTDVDGWTIVARFKGNQIHLQVWNAHLWNVYYHETDGYVDVMFHQKWWSSDLSDANTFSFIADQVLFDHPRKL